MLFHGSPNAHVFKNIDNFFIYQPNQIIDSETFYDKDNQWIQEYKYRIHTNNLGLVQKDRIDLKSPSILVLGDSFTEGQGVGSWVDQLSKNSNATQIQFINGGLLGTGFAQWKLLHDHLQNQGINIMYLVVVFISNDFDRGIWNFKDATLDCLSNYKNCVGDEFFYGTPPESDKLVFLNQLKSLREKILKQAGPKKYSWKFFFPGTSAVIKYVQNFFKTKLKHLKPEMMMNQNAIETLIKQYDDRILFVHIPQKDEILYKKMNPSGDLVRNFIINQGSEVLNGHALCGLTPDDYFINDSHPNSSGYNKIANCVAISMKKKWLKN